MSRSVDPPEVVVSPNQWFWRRGVFTLGEFLNDFPQQKAVTAKSLLAYYVRTGILMRVKRGLYQDTDCVDWIAVGARWTRDAVIGYAAALWLHTPASRREGKHPNVAVVTRSPCAPLVIEEEAEIFCVRAPRPLGPGWWVTEVGVLKWTDETLISVTSFERTIVDLFDRLEWCPSLDSLWREIAHRRPNATAMVDYALKLENRLACARLGFVLDHLPGTKAEDLARLPRLQRPAYFDARKRKDDQQQYRSRWNLMVPLGWAHYLKTTDFYRPEPRFTDLRW